MWISFQTFPICPYGLGLTWGLLLRAGAMPEASAHTPSTLLWHFTLTYYLAEVVPVPSINRSRHGRGTSRGCQFRRLYLAISGVPSRISVAPGPLPERLPSGTTWVGGGGARDGSARDGSRGALGRAIRKEQIG